MPIVTIRKTYNTYCIDPGRAYIDPGRAYIL